MDCQLEIKRRMADRFGGKDAAAEAFVPAFTPKVTEAQGALPS